MLKKYIGIQNISLMIEKMSKLWRKFKASQSEIPYNFWALLDQVLE